MPSVALSAAHLLNWDFEKKSKVKKLAMGDKVGMKCIIEFW